MVNGSIYEALASGRYAFLDLGSGNGGSIRHCEERFGRGRGFGLEINRERVHEARSFGLDVVAADVRGEAIPERSVGFASMMDFLEHLPDEASAVDVLARASRAARDFLFIRHPSFEDVEYLAGLGLKLTWTDWAEHPNMMRLADLRRIFAGFGWSDYEIVPRLPIGDSTHEAILPAAGPRDAQRYEPSHGPKPLARFDHPVYTQFDILIRLNPDVDDAAWQRIVATAYESQGLSGADTIGLYSPADSLWLLRYWNASEWAHEVVQYGSAGATLLPFVGDFDGDGVDGIGVYDVSTSTFFLRNELVDGVADVTVGFGAPGARPLAGDWTGSGRDTIGLYVPEAGMWYLRYGTEPGPADAAFSFGPAAMGWLPVVGDWDGDGRDSIGLYAPAEGMFYLRNDNSSGDADLVFGYGPAGALPVVGDWNDDGRDTVGIYVPSSGECLLRNSNSSGSADMAFSYRVPNALPVAGRWDARFVRALSVVGSR